MRMSPSPTVSAAVIALSAIAAGLIWRYANRIYQSDQRTAWLLGITGLGLPFIVSCACLFRFRAARSSGSAASQPRWLLPLVILTGLAWLLGLVFSLM